MHHFINYYNHQKIQKKNLGCLHLFLKLESQKACSPTICYFLLILASNFLNKPYNSQTALIAKNHPLNPNSPTNYFGYLFKNLEIAFNLLKPKTRLKNASFNSLRIILLSLSYFIQINQKNTTFHQKYYKLPSVQIYHS